MSRELLLDAIRTNWLHDVPRLQYADWLEEYGTCDRDAATAEFIRVSCDCRDPRKLRMPDAAYGWLEHNWQRLIPEVMSAIHIEYRYRSGRKIHLEIKIHAPFKGGWWTKVVTVEFEFHRGFLSNFNRWSMVARDNLLPKVKWDQPFAK